MVIVQLNGGSHLGARVCITEGTHFMGMIACLESVCFSDGTAVAEVWWHLAFGSVVRSVKVSAPETARVFCEDAFLHFGQLGELVWPGAESRSDLRCVVRGAHIDVCIGRDKGGTSAFLGDHGLGILALVVEGRIEFAHPYDPLSGVIMGNVED